MLKGKVTVAVLALSLLALPVAAYLDCWETTVVNGGGGCYWWTSCDIYDDETSEFQGTIKGPIQQCG